MHVLDPDRTHDAPDDVEDRHDGTDVQDDTEIHDGTDVQDDAVIDLTEDRVDDRTDTGPETTSDDDLPESVTVPPRRGMQRVRGMRIKRVRLGSVAMIAAVFFALGWAAVVASGVLAWALANQLGLIADVEEMAITSLGVETFEIAGGALFQLYALVTGVLFGFAYVVTLLFAVIYNAATAILGGVAVETGPLRKPQRVFSLRHRRFITVN